MGHGSCKGGGRIPRVVNKSAAARTALCSKAACPQAINGRFLVRPQLGILTKLLICQPVKKNALSISAATASFARMPMMALQWLFKTVPDIPSTRVGKSPRLIKVRGGAYVPFIFTAGWVGQLCSFPQQAEIRFNFSLSPLYCMVYCHIGSFLISCRTAQKCRFEG